ncbi:MAG TPA: DinB family protein [Lysobacter sp.]
MATYNAWMNDKVLEAAQRLTHDELVADRKAFFGSILATLNHLVTADTIWLKRFAKHPAGHSLLEPIRGLPAPDTSDFLRFSDLESITNHRKWLDSIIVEWAQSVAEQDLDFVMHYTNSRGEEADKDFFGLVMHFFNHQTHHRGQVTTLLSQAGIDVGVTDLLALVPSRSGA